MRKLMVLLVAAFMLAAATSLHAEGVDFTVTPNSACSWEDLVGATLYVSIGGKEKDTDKRKIKIHPGPVWPPPLEEVRKNDKFQVFRMPLTRENVEEIRSHKPDGSATWEDLGFFPVWVRVGEGNAETVSIRHVVVDRTFPCLLR